MHPVEERQGLRGSFKKLRTFDQSGPVRSFTAAAISAAAPDAVVETALGGEHLDAAWARPQADSDRWAWSNRSIAPAHGLCAATAAPCALIPCCFAAATLASAASASSHAASARRQYRARTRFASIVVWKTSRPCVSAGPTGRWWRALASRDIAEPIPGAASETANSRRENGCKVFCPGVGRSVLGAFRQNTAVMLVGLIPTKVGRPQKRSRRSPWVSTRADTRRVEGPPGPRRHVRPRRRPGGRGSNGQSLDPGAGGPRAGPRPVAG